MMGGCTQAKTPQALNRKGNDLVEAGLYEEAIATYDTALKLKPDFPEALIHKGDSLFMLGRYEEAIAAYNTALKLKSDSPEALIHKGDSLFMLGRYEEAIASYDAALKVKTDGHKLYLQTTYFQIARCYILLNKPEESFANLSKAVAFNTERVRQLLGEASDDFASVQDQRRFKAIMGTN